MFPRNISLRQESTYPDDGFIFTFDYFIYIYLCVSFVVEWRRDSWTVVGKGQIEAIVA
jgi:hypothetical protein